MAIDTTVPRSRRALLAASIGGLAAVTAQALGRPLVANAADGNAVLVGGEYTSSSVTKITDTGGDIAIYGASPSNYGVVGVSTSASGVFGESNSGVGVYGYSANGPAMRAEAGGTSPGLHASSVGGHGIHVTSSVGVGVQAVSTSGNAVHGTSTSNAAVAGISNTSYGVSGLSANAIGVYAASDSQLGLHAIGVTGGAYANSTDGFGVKGKSSTTTGVYGVVGNTAEPAAPAKTAVYGYAPGDANARGVHGHATSGRGLFGQATSGNGVRGYATSGIAGYFLSANPASGTALRAAGKVAFDHCAGVATIASGTSSIVVTPGIDVSATSAVVATLMGNAGGSTAVKRVAVNTTSNTFTIYLTANSTAVVKVAWHVFG